MKIAFIGHKRIPSREGGIEIVVDELATRMARRGNQVVAYNRKGHNVAGEQFDGDANRDEPFVYRGVRVVPVATVEAKGLAALSSSFFATLKAIKTRPDVIHYHAEGPCVMLRLAHWAGIRTVATIHGLDWQRAKWGRLASVYLRFGERTAAKCADEVIVLSRNVQDYFRETYGRETRFVPNGIERGERVPAQEITERFGLAKDGYILFLGRIVPEKGVHYLIDAFKRLDTDKKLVIAGGSSDSNEYFERIKQQAAGEPRIVFTGFVEGRTLQELYSNSYIYAAQRFGGYADESAGGDELRQLLPDFRYSRVHGGGGGQGRHVRARFRGFVAGAVGGAASRAAIQGRCNRFHYQQIRLGRGDGTDAGHICNRRKEPVKKGIMMTAVSLEGKTILVTGAAGFIGSNLAERLLGTIPTVQVIGLDNVNDYYDVHLKYARLSKLEQYERFEFIKADLSDKKAIDALFSRYQPEIVVNLAAQAGVRYSITHPDAYIQSNLVGFSNILEACRHHPVEHLVYASSSSVYGGNTKVPFSTSDKVDNPVSLYAATKKSNELMAHAYSKLYDIPSTGLRFFTVYGPAGRPDMAYFGFTNKLIKGETIKIFNYGNCKRDFTYIDDIVEGIVRVMQKAPDRSTGNDGLPVPPYAVYNIGNGHPENLLDFVTILQEELVRAGVLPEDYDFEAHKELVPMQPGDVPVTYADTSALAHDFGYRPGTSLREGLRRFAEWYAGFYHTSDKK